MAAWPGRSGEVEKVAQQLGELTDEKPSFRITVLTTMFQHAVAHLSHGCPNSRWVLLVPFDAETTSADDLSANLRMREGTTSADFVPALRELLLFATRRPECENDEALEAWLAGEPLEPLSHDTKPRHYGPNKPTGGPSVVFINNKITHITASDNSVVAVENSSITTTSLWESLRNLSLPKLV